MQGIMTLGEIREIRLDGYGEIRIFKDAIQKSVSKPQFKLIKLKL